MPRDLRERTAWGWTAGWGGEFALTQNWSARSETKYFSLESVNLCHPVFGTTGFRPAAGPGRWLDLHDRPELPVRAAPRPSSAIPITC